MNPSYFGTAAFVLGGAALIAVAQVFVRERSNDAALRLTAAGGLAIFPVVTRFIHLDLLRMVMPVAEVAAVGAAVWGLFILVDEVHPKQQGVKLPPNIEAQRFFAQGSGIGARIVFAVFVVIAMGTLGRMMGGDAIATYALAAVGAIMGGHLINLRGSWSVWILDRHPERVVWIYPSKLTVVSQRYGTRTVYWRAMLGLLDGSRVALGGTSEESAAALVVDAASICPDAALGHTGELEARFRMAPDSMKKGSPTTGPRL